MGSPKCVVGVLKVQAKSQADAVGSPSTRIVAAMPSRSKGKAMTALPGLESATERDPLDFNRTPAWVVELLIPHLGAPRTVLDVGCGDGAIGRVLRQAWPDAEIFGIEADYGRVTASRVSAIYDDAGQFDWVADAVGWDLWTWRERWEQPYAPPDLIISNPPFGLPALRFLERALERVAPGGTVAFLLPTHWDHDPDVTADREVDPSGQRYEAFARQRFLDRLRLPDGSEGYGKLAVVGGGPYPARPSFKRGATASDRYAWFMFGPGRAGVHRRPHAIPPPEASGQLTLAV